MKIQKPPAEDMKSGPTQDFEIMRSNTHRLARKTSFEERIEFITELNAMSGHKRRAVVPITGDKFLL